MIAISHASKVMLKILQARLQQCVNPELPDVQNREPVDEKSWDPKKQRNLKIRDKWLEYMGFSDGYQHSTSRHQMELDLHK